jgi:hypothetical protein
MADEGLDFANEIKTRLEAITDFTGRVHVYIPPVRDEQDTKAYFVETDGEKRLNTWFITRARLMGRKYGEENRIPSRYRARHHVYQITGYISVIGDLDPSSGLASEERFQNLVDQIEETFGPVTSLGKTDRTVSLTGFDAEVRYQEQFGVLCHMATIMMTVTEYVQTSYTL